MLWFMMTGVLLLTGLSLSFQLPSLPCRVDSVGPGCHDPIHHLQLPVSLPLLLPALHFAEGWTLLPHWNLPDPCQ